MSSLKIQGGHKLKGEITPQGAKNEALQILCAVLLTPEPVTVHNVPNIRDVNKLIELLSALGVVVEKLGEESYRFTARDIDITYLESADFKTKAASIRGSIMILGPLLTRYGKGKTPKPGGDKIGRRRLDTHFIGFEKLGAKFNYDSGDMGPVVVATLVGSSVQASPLRDTSAEIVMLPADTAGGVDLSALLRELGGRECNDVLVEAGPRLAGRILASDLCDELIVYFAPKVLGPDAQPMFDLPSIRKLQDSLQFRLQGAEPIGPDLKVRFMRRV